MIRCNKIIYILFFVSIFHNIKAQQNLLDFDNSLKFARYLFTTQQLNFAAQEYERLNYLWPNDSIIIYELVQTYRINNQCEKFLTSVNLLSEDDRLFNNIGYKKEYLRFSLACRIKDRNYFNLISKLNPEEKAFYTASYYWINQQHDTLINYYLNDGDLIAKANLNLHDVTKSFSEQQYKSPFLSSLMSTILPGSGKAYVNRWGDAFISFLFVGTNTYASYRAFKKKGVNSVNGWIFGSLAISFYSANIWGSAKAAKNYNAGKMKTFQSNAENIIYNSF